MAREFRLDIEKEEARNSVDEPDMEVDYEVFRSTYAVLMSI